MKNLEKLKTFPYWCNNAKTDTFTEGEFLNVVQVLKTILEQRLNIEL